VAPDLSRSPSRDPVGVLLNRLFLILGPGWCARLVCCDEFVGGALRRRRHTLAVVWDEIRRSSPVDAALKDEVDEVVRSTMRRAVRSWTASLRGYPCIGGLRRREWRL
jgi:hypothetical protein